MKKKVLIIEDDNILRTTLKTALESAKFNVIEVSDGADAYRAIKKEKPHLVLLDLLLPNKDGREILKEVQKDKAISDIPVYVFTVVEDENSMAECLSLGAKRYFLKSDYTLEEVVAKVEKYFETYE